MQLAAVTKVDRRQVFSSLPSNHLALSKCQAVHLGRLPWRSVLCVSVMTDFALSMCDVTDPPYF
jgi:hypothetical protein